VVDVDEGQISYMGPALGGFVSVPELVELRLVTLRGRRLWRLKQGDGQVLLIPVDAAGAEGLFDVFAACRGWTCGASGGLASPEQAGGGRRWWRRQAAGDGAVRQGCVNCLNQCVSDVPALDLDRQSKHSWEP
jgi:hypothetical protein